MDITKMLANRIPASQPDPFLGSTFSIEGRHHTPLLTDSIGLVSVRAADDKDSNQLYVIVTAVVLGL